MTSNKTILHIALRSHAYCNYPTLKSCEKASPMELLKNPRNKFKDADLIIIDLNYAMDGKFKGLELLKLIRLNYIDTHCVVYSFLPELHHVKEDANKSILLSKGVSFVQMPFIIDDEFVKDLFDKKSPENLEDYYLHDYGLFFSGNRHFNANWWAPLRIMEYLMRADDIENEDVMYTSDEARKSKASYSGMVLRYIKTLKERSVWDGKMKGIVAENVALKAQNRQLEEARVAIEESIDKIFEGIQDEELKNSSVFSATARLDSRIKNNEEIIESKQEDIERYQQSVETVFDENTAAQNSIESLRRSLGQAGKKPRILYLDDMAGYGWEYVLQRLIYREDKSADFEEVFSDEQMSGYLRRDEYDKLADALIAQAKENQINLLIMDLRLKNETGEIRAKDLSGIRLLEALREKRIACPILMITASKDPETIEQIFDSGVDACWRKEGIDENNDSNPAMRVAYTWGKIEKLLYIIKTLCGDEFQYLYGTMVTQYYKVIEQCESQYWWEVVGLRNNTGMHSIEKTEFLKQLGNTICAYQKVLVDKLKGKEVWHEFLIPCNTLFTIMEAIHPGRMVPEKNSRPKKIKGFGDLLNYDFGLESHNNLPVFLQNVFESITIRNDIVHVNNANKTVDFAGFKSCVDKLVKGYLMHTYSQVYPYIPWTGEIVEENCGHEEDSCQADVLKGVLKISINQYDSNGERTNVYYNVRNGQRINLCNNQRVTFLVQSICNFELKNVRLVENEAEENHSIDCARIEDIRENPHSGQLQCQLSDLRLKDRRLGRMFHEELQNENQSTIRFSPVNMKEGSVDVDLLCDDDKAWEGRFGSVQYSPESVIKLVRKIQCLDSTVWFKVEADSPKLKVGDRVQFQMVGGYTTLATDVKEDI